MLGHKGVRVRAPTITSILVLSLATTACFEEPIRERIHLTMLGGEATVLTTVLEISPPGFAGTNTELAGRLDDARAELDGGWDRWRPLYDRLEPAAESYRLERVDGLARRAVYSAVVPDFGRVERFFGSEGLSSVLVVDGPIHELQLYPAGGTRATWSQQQEVERAMDGWSAAVAEYLAASIQLWAYLESRPDRAVPCFSHLFDSHGPDSGPLTEVEEGLVQNAKDTMETVADALMVPDGAAYSPNELSRLVYDPFPTRLTVSIRGRILDVAGFREGDGFVERLPVDLWQALVSLEGRWLSPDPVTAAVLPDAELPEIDPVAFAGLPRWHSEPPGAAEVADGLTAQLVPPDVCAIQWTSTSVGIADLEEGDPRRWIEAAEAVIPR